MRPDRVCWTLGAHSAPPSVGALVAFFSFFCLPSVDPVGVASGSGAPFLRLLSTGCDRNAASRSLNRWSSSGSFRCSSGSHVLCLAVYPLHLIR